MHACWLNVKELAAEFLHRVKLEPDGRSGIYTVIQKLNFKKILMKFEPILTVFGIQNLQTFDAA